MGTNRIFVAGYSQRFLANCLHRCTKHLPFSKSGLPQQTSCFLCSLKHSHGLAKIGAGYVINPYKEEEEV